MREALILAGAEADLLAAYCWFEAFDPELADRFDAAVHETIELLGQFPEMGAAFRGKFRRCRVPGSVFAIFYSIDAPTRLAVSAILDLRQDPAAILRRLGIE